MNYTLLIGYTELSWQLLLDILIQHAGKLRVQRNEIRYPNLLAFCLSSCPFPAVIFWSEFSCTFTECFTHVHWRAPAPEGWLLWARPWAAIWSSQGRIASDLQLPSACPPENVTSGLCRHMAAAGTSRFIEGQGMSHQGHNVTRVPTTTQHRVACGERLCCLCCQWPGCIQPYSQATVWLYYCAPDQFQRKLGLSSVLVIWQQRLRLRLFMLLC